jgi:hypothetical protein
MGFPITKRITILCYWRANLPNGSGFFSQHVVVKFIASEKKLKIKN